MATAGFFAAAPELPADGSTAAPHGRQMSRLWTEHLGSQFQQRSALDDVSLRFYPGEATSLVGPNGADKSTLLKCLAGMLPATHGDVLLDGTPVRRPSPRVAYVPQRSDVDWRFPITVLDVALMGRALGVNRLLPIPARDRRAALAIGFVTQSGLLRNDTAIGVFFVGAFALGVAIISTQQSYARDVTNLLFGSILGVSRDDLALTALVGLGVLVAIWLFRRGVVTISFDRTDAQSQGLNLWGWDQLFLLLLALTIVISLQTVGNILVLAMLVTPAATARLLTVRLVPMIAVSASIGAFSGVAGLYLSYYRGVSSGASIVLVATAIFIAVFLLAPRTGAITARVARRLHFGHPERDQFATDEPSRDGYEVSA